MSVMWGQELSSALKHAGSLLEDTYEEGSTKANSKARIFGLRLKDALAAIWKDGTADVVESRFIVLLLAI